MKQAPGREVEILTPQEQRILRFAFEEYVNLVWRDAQGEIVAIEETLHLKRLLHLLSSAKAIGFIS